MRLALIGIALGIASALVTGRFLSAWLSDVPSQDVATIGVVSAMLLAVAALACYFPALRATRVDPITALGEQ